MVIFRSLAWSAIVIPSLAAPHGDGCGSGPGKVTPVKRISLGPRPYWLVDQMDEGPLKTKLASCSEKEMKRSDWSISHRGGGTLQFPEHTHGSIMAGVSCPACLLK
jgi:glycerophosphoryl diester phosphodiesterase